jgi:hypothetical protein
MPHCTVCHHPQKLAIDQALLTGAVTQLSLAQQYGLSKSAVSRHKDHLKDTMSRARGRFREIREQGRFFLLNESLEHVRQSMAVARAENDYTAVCRCANTVGRLSQQMGRLDGDLKLATLHRLLTSPAWQPGPGLLPTDPELLTCLHQALLDDALALCPDLPPELSAADPETVTPDSQLPTLATLHQVQNLLGNPDLTLDEITPDPEPPKKPWKIFSRQTGRRQPATASPQASPRQLQNLLTKLDLSLDDLPDADPSPGTHRDASGTPAGRQRDFTGTPAGNERESRGKSLKKTAAANKKTKQIQKVEASTKKSPKIPAAAPDDPSVRRQPQVGECHPQGGDRPNEVPPAFREDTLPAVPVSADAVAYSSPETANQNPESVFSPDLLESDEPQENVDASTATLDETQAAELAAYLAAFPPYARTQNPDSTIDEELILSPNTEIRKPETVSSAARPAPDSLITAHKRPAFLPPPDPGDPAAPGPPPAARAPWIPRPRTETPKPKTTSSPPPAQQSGRPPDPPNFGTRIFRNLSKYF